MVDTLAPRSPQGDRSDNSSYPAVLATAMILLSSVPGSRVYKFYGHRPCLSILAVIIAAFGDWYDVW